MGRLSGISNPTSLKEIPKNRISLSVTETGGKKSFALEKLDVSEMDIPADALLICNARAGKSSRRFDLGNITTFNRKPQPLDGLDESSSLKFRVLIRNPQNPILIASAENIRPITADDQQGESLIPMTGAELGQLLWKLEIEDTGPSLLFNNKIFPNAAGAENFLPFVALVLPEALRQVLLELADNPENLNDESHWMYYWGEWLDSLTFSRPTGDDKFENAEWINEILELFCQSHVFADHLYNYMRGDENASDKKA